MYSSTLLAEPYPRTQPLFATLIAREEPALPGTAITLAGLGPWQSRNQDAFHWIDPRPCDRSRLACAPFDVCSRPPRTLSPTANQPCLSTRSCRVKLTPAQSCELLARIRRTGKVRLPNFCNRPTPRAPCRSLGSRITAPLGFRRGAQLPPRRPGSNLGRKGDRGQPRLTPRRSFGTDVDRPRSPEAKSPPGPDELLTGLSERCSFLIGVVGRERRSSSCL